MKKLLTLLIGTFLSVLITELTPDVVRADCTIVGESRPCPGVSTSYSVTSSCVTSGSTIIWYIDGTVVGSGQAFAKTWSCTGGTLKVEVKNHKNNDPDTLCCSAELSIFPKLPPACSITGNTFPCPGVQCTYNLQANDLCTNASIIWKIDGTQVATSQSVSKTWDCNQHTLRCEISYGVGCVQSCDVLILPETWSTVGNISWSGGSGTGSGNQIVVNCCNQNNITFCAPGFPCAPSSWSWTLPSGWRVVSTNDPCITVHPDQNTAGTVTCMLTTPCGIRTATLNVIRPSAPPLLSGAAHCVCINESNILTATNLCGTAGTYHWSISPSPDGFSIQDSPNDEFAYVFTQNGDYTVSCYVSTLCGNSDPTTFDVHVGPPVISAIQGPDEGCALDLLEFSVDNPDGCAATWTWTSPTPGVTIYNTGYGYAAVRASTSYQLCVTATSACGTSNRVCKYVTLGIHCAGSKSSTGAETPNNTFTISQPEFERKMELAPNPSTGSFNLKLPATESILDVVVVDAGGRIVRTLPASQEQGVNLTAVPSGTYFVIVRTAKYTVVRSVSLNR